MSTFDRRLRFQIPTPGHRDSFGEFIPGVPIVIDTWASKSPDLRLRTDDEQGFDVEVGGIQVERRNTFVIRWNETTAILLTTEMLNNVLVTDDLSGTGIPATGRRFVPTSVRELGRRRNIEVTLARAMDEENGG